MNKYRGSNFEDYLKEKGIFEEVLARAKKQWEALRAEASVGSEGTTKSPGDPSQQRNGFFSRLRRGVNHWFSQLRPHRK